MAPITPKDWQALVACGVELRRFALSLTRDGPDADDLVQATYARAVMRFDQWRRQGELRSWLFSIMQSIQNNEWRQQKQHASAMATMTPLSLATVDGERTTGDKLRLQAVCKAIDRLPANQRDALMAVVRDEMSYRDAASQLGIPVGTLTSRITRARQTVADATRPSGMPVLKKAGGDE